jgi:hypothetical protein
LYKVKVGGTKLVFYVLANTCSEAETKTISLLNENRKTSTEPYLTFEGEVVIHSVKLFSRETYNIQ